jgi:hypothetical protein
VIAFAKPTLENLVTFRPEGTAATIHRLGKSETHIEWRGFRRSSVRAGLVTEADRTNGISRKFSVGLDCDTHRTWDRTAGRWSEWRAAGYILFPSALHMQDCDGRMELTTTFQGTFGRGPGTPETSTAKVPETSPAPRPRKDWPMPPGIKPID